MTAYNGGHQIRLTIPAKAEYIALGRLALAGLVGRRGLSDETLADLKLALTEACSNSVRHAYPGREGTVEILYELHDDRLAIEVADEGKGFDPDEESPNGNGELTEGGLGIAIIRSIVDDLELGPQDHGSGSRLRFVKRLARPE